MTRIFSDLIKSLVLAALLFFIVQAVVQNYQVFGASMEPSVQSGEHIIVNKAAYASLNLGKISKIIPFYTWEKGDKFYLFGEPRRGDVVVIKSPNPPPDRLIKRIIGLPGDIIEIRSGNLLVNGIKLEEPYTNGFNPNIPLTTVPEDHYYLLGDNRSHSNDSKYFGPVHRSDIVGKAWLAYWPLGVFGIVESYELTAPKE